MDWMTLPGIFFADGGKLRFSPQSTLRPHHHVTPMSEPSVVPNGFYDEMYDAHGHPRRKTFAEKLKGLTFDDLRQRQNRAESTLLTRGITFAVYGDQAGNEKIWPFDVIPRIIDGPEWQMIENGLKQRIRALNLFIDDVYNKGQILNDKVVPEEMILTAKTFRPQCKGLKPTKGVWAHVTGTDLVRNSDGQIYVLEDNLRCPSGVSYVLENREIMKRILPEVFQGTPVAPVEDYPECLLQTLMETAPPSAASPTAVVLTPGIFNSAYFEHSFLAQQMGIELVQGSDLSVENGRVVMHTTKGKKQVDVIYRRIDDDFLDPKCFREDSALGVAGLMDVVKAGRVTLANAPGTGIADDKALYSYVPQIIKYYLNEDAILPNVPTYICSEEKQKDYVLSHLDQLVVKPTNESGGYGILMGPQASKEDREKCAPSREGEPQKLHRPADAEPVHRADHRGRPHRTEARGFSTVHPLRRGHLRSAGWAHAGGVKERLLDRQFLPRRRQQGHLGPGLKRSQNPRPDRALTEPSNPIAIHGRHESITVAVGRVKE